MTISPNMGLNLPEVLVTLGPAYASMINTAFQTVDSHNHAAGSGAQVGTAGFRIDADLSFNGYNATDLRSTRLSDQTSIVLTGDDLRMLYSKSGEFYYRDAAGNQVQITSAGSVVGPPGNISGLVSPASATYGGGRFSFFADTSKPGKLTISDIDLYEFNNATAQPIIIKSPTSVVGWTLTLPAVVATANDTPVIASTTGAWTTLPNPNMSVGTVNVAGKITNADGGAAVPTYTFNANTNTGIYRAGANIIGFSTNGTQRLTINAIGQLEVGDGTAVAPSFTFAAAGGTGHFRVAGALGSAVAGAEILRLNGTGLKMASAKTILSGAGAAALPGYGFEADSTMGMFYTGGFLGFSTGAAERFRITATGALSGNLSPSNGPLRWETYSLSVATGATTTQATSGTIKGICGHFTETTTNNSSMIGQAGGAGTNIAYFTVTSSPSVFGVRNPTANNGTARITVFY